MRYSALALVNLLIVVSECKYTIFFTNGKGIGIFSHKRVEKKSRRPKNAAKKGGERRCESSLGNKIA